MNNITLSKRFVFRLFVHMRTISLMVCGLLCAGMLYAAEPKYRMSFITAKEPGSIFTFSVNAESEDQDGVWLDKNNNGIQDKGEKVTAFGFEEECEISFPIQSQQMVLYGKVTSFHCGDNDILVLQVNENPALEYLSCSYNKIRSLDVHTNTRLKTLFCYNNKLYTLDVSANTELEELWCSDNRITALNVGMNTELTWLWCDNNRLQHLDVSRNLELENLSCGGNRLDSLDIRVNTELTDILCSSNRLTALDVSCNKNLTRLICSYNELTNIDLRNNPHLTQLWCEGNFLTALDVSANRKLNVIDCSKNNLNGKGMEAFIQSLCPLSPANTGKLVIINTRRNDKNVCTKAHVSAARAKNWEVYDDKLILGEKIYQGSGTGEETESPQEMSGN